jgi:hypothetical protein
MLCLICHHLVRLVLDTPLMRLALHPRAIRNLTFDVDRARHTGSWGGLGPARSQHFGFFLSGVCEDCVHYQQSFRGLLAVF